MKTRKEKKEEKAERARLKKQKKAALDAAAEKSTEAAEQLKIRIQFEFAEKAVKQLDNVKDLAGLSSRAEVLARALALFYKAIEVQKEGGKFGFLDKDGNLSWYIFPGVKCDKAEARPGEGQGDVGGDDEGAGKGGGTTGVEGSTVEEEPEATGGTE
jgi:hypothetical protein